jgi:hypothetical protein
VKLFGKVGRYSSSNVEMAILIDLWQVWSHYRTLNQDG